MPKFVKLTVITGTPGVESSAFEELPSRDFTLNADLILHYSQVLVGDWVEIECVAIALKPEAAKNITVYTESEMFSGDLSGYGPRPELLHDYPDTLCVKNTYEDINKQLGVK